MKKRFCITAGEPNSINSEIVAKSWKKISKEKKKYFFLIGNYDLIKAQLKKIKIKIPIYKINSSSGKLSNKHLNILDIKLKSKNPFSVNKSVGSKYVLECLNKAHNLSINKQIKGFINCPINKKNVFNSENIGVTEYLAKKNKVLGREAMLIFNQNFSVTPITTHINVKDISKEINKEKIIKKVITINNFYTKVLKKRPIIAVLGLNPHNDEFRKKSEEVTSIIPAIKFLKNKKYKVIGPLPADTAFSYKKKYKFDVVVGMYHDQVLGPFKALHGFNGINLTLGLDYYRASPDHGTASDIIGLGKANYKSLLDSINFFFKI